MCLRADLRGSGGVEGREVELRVGVNATGDGSGADHVRYGFPAFYRRLSLARRFALANV
jgi:hypothetical protein